MPTMQTADHADHADCRPCRPCRLQTMQTMQTADHADHADCRPCRPCRLQTMPTVQTADHADRADCRPCRPCRLQTEDFFLTIDSRFSVLVTKYIVRLWVFSLSLSLLSVTAKTLRETNSLFVRSRSNCLNCQATQATADMTVLVLQMRPLHLSSDNTKEEK